MTITATWYEPTKGYNLVEVDIDLFAMPAATAELIEKIRIAKSSRAKDSIKTAASLADRAVKTGLIKKNKASRIKSSLSHLSKAK